MTSTETTYFRSRADEERLAAGEATDDRAAEAHREMARQDDERAVATDDASAPAA